jgi:hypothetical protein
VRLEATYINEIARTSGFDPANLEKAIRLKELLCEFHRHPFLNTACAEGRHGYQSLLSRSTSPFS